MYIVLMILIIIINQENVSIGGEAFLMVSCRIRGWSIKELYWYGLVGKPVVILRVAQDDSWSV